MTFYHQILISEILRMRRRTFDRRISIKGSPIHSPFYFFKSNESKFMIGTRIDTLNSIVFRWRTEVRYCIGLSTCLKMRIKAKIVKYTQIYLFNFHETIFWTLNHSIISLFRIICTYYFLQRNRRSSILRSICL